MLVLLGPASAVQIILNAPDDIIQGEDVSFNVTVEFDVPDQYLPIQYTDIIFTGPNSFEKTCRVYNDGSYSNCDLDLDIIVSFNTGFGEGIGFGYDYGYGSYHAFGEGYGYGYGYYGGVPEINYEIIWHTVRDLPAGEYDVKAEMFALGDDQYQDFYGFSYCGAMEGMYIEWISLNPPESDYDSNLDLYEDGVIDLSDIVIFSQNRFNESWCGIYSGDEDCSILYGRFKEFYRIRSNGGYNENLDLNDDADVDFDDLLIFLQNREETWCADQIAFLFEAVSHIFGSSTESFNINSPVETTSSGDSRGRRNPINETNETLIEVEENNNEEELLSEEQVVEETPVLISEESKNLFNSITGAVTGLGDSIGLGATLSYIAAILLFFIILLGGFGIVRVVKRR